MQPELFSRLPIGTQYGRQLTHFHLGTYCGRQCGTVGSIGKPAEWNSDIGFLS